MRQQRLALYQLPDYIPRTNRLNDYGFDPHEQAHSTYTGMGDDINVHDQWAVESMGAIQDRTKEHLGASDKAIAAYRRLLVRAIRDVAEGRKPLLALPAPNRPAASMARPRSTRSGRWRAGRSSGGSRIAAAARDARIPVERRARSRRLRRNGQPRHRHWTPEQHDAAEAVEARIADLGVVRLAFADAHGVLRGKTLVAEEAIRVLRQGANATTTLLMKDLSGKTAFPVFTRRWRLRHAGPARRRRHGDAARPAQLSRAALGAA